MSNSNPQVKVNQFINAPRAKVYAAWVRPELAVKWWSAMELKPVEFRNNLEVGGKYYHKMTGKPGTFETVGKYLEIKPNEKLVFTWGSADGPEPESVVTVVFEDHLDGTMVTLTQEKLPRDLVPSHQEGWKGALLHLEQFFNNQ